MKYNDFPILSNGDYQILNVEYSRQNPTRKELIFEIQKELRETHLSFFQLKNHFNKHIEKSLHELHNHLIQVSDSINELFKLSTIDSLTISNFNIFNLIRRTIKINTMFNQWSQIEEKEYYKKFAIQSSKNISNLLINLATILEQSNIHFFKHM